MFPSATINLPYEPDYLKAANAVNAINPAHQTAVRNWAIAMRLVDYNVDCAAHYEDNAGGIIRESCIAPSIKKHLATEERYWNQAQDIESYLPKRELENAVKQLVAACNGGTAAI
jgi:hypothetical protein